VLIPFGLAVATLVLGVVVGGDDDDDGGSGGGGDKDDDGILTDTSSMVDGLFCRRISTLSNRIIVLF